MEDCLRICGLFHVAAVAVGRGIRGNSEQVKRYTAEIWISLRPIEIMEPFSSRGSFCRKKIPENDGPSTG